MGESHKTTQAHVFHTIIIIELHLDLKKYIFIKYKYIYLYFLFSNILKNIVRK